MNLPRFCSLLTVLALSFTLSPAVHAQDTKPEGSIPAVAEAKEAKAKAETEVAGFAKNVNDASAAVATVGSTLGKTRETVEALEKALEAAKPKEPAEEKKEEKTEEPSEEEKQEAANRENLEKAEKDLADTDEELKALELKVRQAQTDLAQLEAVAAEKGITPEQLDAAKQALELAEKEVRAARTQYKDPWNKIKNAKKDLGQLPKLSGTFWAIVPPIFAILLALITKEVYSSLFLGVLLGGIFAADAKPYVVLDKIINDGLIEAVKGTAGVFIFLVILGIIVALLNRTGASLAFGNWAKNHVKSRTGSIFATTFLGILIFIDDYFNCLTVGSVMLPVTDAKKVSRAKLAYIIDATAAPICMIAPVSSWAAAVSSYAEGTQYSGLDLFIKAIPFNFYSLLTFVFIIGITCLKIDFGPMAIHERNAITKGDLFTSGGEVDNGIRPLENARGKIVDLVIPIIILIAFSVIALLYVGEYFEGTKTFAEAFSDTDATVGLPWGGVVVLVLTILYLIGRRIISFKEALKCVPEGFNAMVPAILILTLATALKNMTSLLEAKEYIAGLMDNAAVGLDRFLPAVIFIVACVLAFATGTSWGTFGILIPIVVSIFPSTSPLLFIGMSACLAGAVCGDHCSPISDTTIMSSAGARCEHINHVSTQLPYAITVAALSFLGFILAGFIQEWLLVFPLMVVITIALLVFFKIFTKKQPESAE